MKVSREWEMQESELFAMCKVVGAQIALQSQQEVTVDGKNPMMGMDTTGARVRVRRPMVRHIVRRHIGCSV